MCVVPHPTTYGDSHYEKILRFWSLSKLGALLTHVQQTLSELYPNIIYREVTLVPPVLLGFPEAAAVALTEVLAVQLRLLLLLASLGLS